MVTFGSNKVRAPRLKGRIYLIFFAVVMVIFIWAVAEFGQANVDKQKESLENALDRAIVQCYALEGTYPPSLDYIKEHYGLTYNEDLFYVTYESIGSNLRPDVTIIVRGDS